MRGSVCGRCEAWQGVGAQICHSDICVCTAHVIRQPRARLVQKRHFPTVRSTTTFRGGVDLFGYKAPLRPCPVSITIATNCQIIQQLWSLLYVLYKCPHVHADYSEARSSQNETLPPMVLYQSINI